MSHMYIQDYSLKMFTLIPDWINQNTRGSLFMWAPEESLSGPWRKGGQHSGMSWDFLSDGSSKRM